MTLRKHLNAIDKLSDPLPKTTSEAYDRLCLICEEVEAALVILAEAERCERGFRCWESVEDGDLLVIHDPEPSA